MTNLVTLFSTKTRRYVAVGAFALATGAAVVAPAFSATSTSGPEISAQPACLAWFGNKEDGKCLSYSNGMPANVGTPWVGAGGNGGFVTGPLLPGTSINQGIG
ncbi:MULTISPECIES: DUF7155 family protein [Mycolicibacterium]|uniref:Uncharacterized protein n=2 Tax=Mycolicibacterium TaxID=1866885 RepID=A0A378SZ78_9MYCO|nr:MULTISPECIES: hypothetical protein [Mycolicibacterium]MCW1823052.1 hypothetical protein [Mycolicibacterium senegalense]MDR7290796.1 hypothetical protein [Mycolicibacterium senegalense]CDP89129.1 hypothetical protein BN975_04977 [Mycolicibacterium farcinogenes]CQD21673.1 hypothetical protein BN970_05089 [Mycolicibacterium conceptionense]STZ53852.1 Uncharacterised protein [Mycolicibacterium senegalense]